MDLIEKAQRRVTKAKTRLLFDHPFFATLLLTTQIVIVPADHPQVDTMGTDGTRIYCNAKFVCDQPGIEDVMAALVHEVGHDMLLHSLRMEMRHPILWNIAGDHAINLMLEDQGIRAPRKLEGGWLADPKYKGWTAERIYADLQQEVDKMTQQGGEGDESSEGDESGEGGGSGGQQPSDARGKAISKLPQGGLSGDLMPSPCRTETERAEAERKAKARVATAATQARLAGKLNGDLARMVDEFVDPKVPWSEVLRDYLLSFSTDDESWLKRNRRYDQFFLPARYSEDMGPIIIIGDSSGSIWCSPQELEMFATEIQSVSDMVNPEHIRLIWADTEVAGEEVFERGDLLKFEVKGGGGTDMRVPLKYVEQYEPAVVILLTDGYTPWPSEEPPFPLITCCSTEVDVPIGVRIQL